MSQKTQRELQTREQEEVAEINQAQHLKLLHSCKDIPTFYQCAKVQSCFINGSNGCVQYSLSFEGGSFALVTAEKWNKDSGLRRSMESPNPEDEA